MELHDTMYAFGLQTGRDVFDDPDRLRAMLAQSGTPAGEADLVVDAVRRGAYRAMLIALDSGVDPARAVQETGARLAHERGSDVGSAAWSLAVLGFAVGRLGENDVRRHRGAGPVVPPSQAPTRIGSAMPPATNPRLEKPASYQPPPAAPPGYGQPAQPAYQQHPQPWSPSGPVPPKKSKLPIILGVGGTVTAVIVAIVLAIVIAGGGGGDTEESGTGTDPTSSTTSEPTTEPTSSAATSEPTTEVSTDPADDPGRVSDEAAAGYTTTLLTFSTDFGTAGDKLSKASANDNTRGAKAAARDLRKAVYDLDLSTRALDLTPVQTEVNAFLKVSSRMIDKLDAIEQTATTALDVNLGVIDLPITQYTDSFQALADAIDASRA